MVVLDRSVRICLAISLMSLLIYTSYILRGSVEILIGYLNGVSSDVNYVAFVGTAFWAGWISLTARLIGLVLALSVVYLLWIRSLPFVRVKKFVAAALVLESVSFLGLVPSLWLLLTPFSPIFTPTLGYGYLIQILFVVPPLLALAYRVAKYQESSEKSRLLKVGSVSFVGYTIALVTNEVSRWVSMLNLESLQFVAGIRAVGLFNAVVFMPFAIVFAIVAAWRLFNHNLKSAMRWIGVSLLVIGLNYCIYLGFVVAVDALNTLPVVDIWTIPLAALGVALILNSYKKSKYFA